MQQEQSLTLHLQPVLQEQDQLEQLFDNQPKLSVLNLPDANPIKKRQKLQPCSIFPLQALPKFNYNSDVNQPTVVNQSVSLVQQKLVLQSSSLKELFSSPVYVYNSRASTKSNSDFGCIRVMYSESKDHKMGKNIQTFTEAKAQSKRMKFESETVNKSQNISTNIEKQVQNEQKNQLQSQYSRNNQAQDQQVYFQSRFESGNLCFAAPSRYSNQPTYYLILSRDMNTSKCTQWFFFKTVNKLPGKVTFHILNFVKNYSIFEYGMKICYASKANGYKWLRGCTDIKYRQTNVTMNSRRSQKCYHALSFSYTYESAEDNVYFAYCYPYTYSMLEQFLFNRSETSPYMKRRCIAGTPGGNSVDLITISNFKQKQYKKRIVFITSRVHPGQTPSSFICEGMMRFLLGETDEAKSLRDNFVFKFVPMLNPDGVINGSYRCSLSGYDLNRVWHRADKITHPEIYGTRKAVFETNQFQKIFMFADLHAHSKKKGVFAYGCQNRSNPYLCRQIPFLFWKNVPDFNYYQCNFMMRTGRQGTSRLFNYRQLDINYSYTIEHSFCGPAKDRVHYTPKSYVKIGVDYLLTFYKYFCRNRKAGTINSDISELEIFQELYVNKELLKIGDAEECSSSDQQLDKQRAPSCVEHKSQKSQRRSQRKQTLRLSQNSLHSPKKTSSNFRKTNLVIQNKSKELLSTKFRDTPNFRETMRPLPIVDTSFKQRPADRYQESTQYMSFRPRVCSSSLTGHMRPENIEKKYFMKQTFRYEDEEEVGGLTNLFLPSLTRASYKKYNRKNSSPKNMVQVGQSLIQTAIVLKEQIRSVARKRPSWKDQARSYL